MKSRIGIGLFCLLLPLHAFAGNMQVVVCKRGHLNFLFGPLSAAKGDHTITAIWLDGSEKDKKFGLGHAVKVSPNGDFIVLVAEPSKDKPGPGSEIIYTAGLHQAVLVANLDPDAETSVAIADCIIKDFQNSKHS